ncbi:MAG: hypothetical protein J6L76_00285 [Clostridia bacterium]|nr:hypothetical protein [Clostridia bacterium]
MRKMRGFSKTVAVVLCTAMLLSGIVLPQGAIAGDVTVGMNTVYPDDLLTADVFDDYFSGSATATFSNNAMTVSGSGLLTSKAPIDADTYVISFETKFDSEVGLRFKTNSTANNFYGIRLLNSGDYTLGMAKSRTDQDVLLYGSPAYSSTYDAADNWMTVTVEVGTASALVTLEYVAIDGSDATKNYTVDYNTAYTPASNSNVSYETYLAGVENYIAFYREGGDFTVRNFQAYTIPEEVKDVEGALYPKNLLASKYIFNEYFKDTNNTCTFTQEGSEYVMKVQPGTACVVGSGIVSKQAIAAKEYTISFDAKFSSTEACGGPVFLYKTDAETDAFMGTFWNAYNAGAMNVHHKVSAEDNAAISQPEAKFYQARPASTWMHVTYAVSETETTCTFSSGSASVSYTVNYASQGFANGLENHIVFLTQSAGDSYYIKNLQVMTETTTADDGLYPNNLFAGQGIYAKYFNDGTSKGTLAVDDGAYVLNVVKGAVIPTKAIVNADAYTISFDALLPENGSDVGIRFKADAGGTAAFRGLRILNTTWGSVAVYSKTPTAQTALGDNATPRPAAGDWMHVDIVVDTQNVTVTLTNGTTGKAHTYTVWEYNTAGDTLGQYIAIYQEGSATTIKNFQVVTAKDVSGQEIPTKDGYLFSGYYTDATLSEQYTETTGSAYRKFVDANVLSVKAQKSDGTGGAKNVRFVTSVDSLNYGKVGFEITVGNKTITKETTKVYAQLQAGTQQVDPSVFSSQSQYMAAYSLWEIPESAFDTEIKVRAYWETPEGLIVYGAYRTVTVNGLA